MGLLPEEPLESPEILSGATHRFAFPEYSYGGHGAIKQEIIKQEIINLDDYQSTHADHQYLNPSFGKNAETSHHPSHSMLSSSTNNFVRPLSFRRPAVPEDYLNIPESPNFHNEATTSDGSDGDESILQGLENVDWSALLQPEPQPLKAQPEFARCPSSGKMTTDPSSVLVQIKRQNSDLFSSLDLWNYSQVAQHM
jgi:hypothetical protein